MTDFLHFFITLALVWLLVLAAIAGLIALDVWLAQRGWYSSETYINRRIERGDRD